MLTVAKFIQVGTYYWNTHLSQVPVYFILPDPLFFSTESGSRFEPSSLKKIKISDVTFDNLELGFF